MLGVIERNTYKRMLFSHRVILVCVVSLVFTSIFVMVSTPSPIHSLWMVGIPIFLGIYSHQRISVKIASSFVLVMVSALTSATFAYLVWGGH